MHIQVADILDCGYSDRMQPYWINSTPIIADEIHNYYESEWHAVIIENAKFAEHHRQLIQRYGRFSHRNLILGRESSSAEVDCLDFDQAFRG